MLQRYNKRLISIKLSQVTIAFLDMTSTEHVCNGDETHSASGRGMK